MPWEGRDRELEGLRDVLVEALDREPWDAYDKVYVKEHKARMPLTWSEGWEGAQILSGLQYVALSHLFMNAGFITQV